NHPFGFSIRRSHRTAVEMIASDHDWRVELPVANHLVQRHSEFGAGAVTEPADARRQPLKLDSLARKLQPPVEYGVVRKKLLRQIVRFADVFWIARQRHPAERPSSLAKERSNVFGHEAGNFERVFDAHLFRLRANVIAVIESHGAHSLQIEHRANVR